MKKIIFLITKKKTKIRIFKYPTEEFKNRIDSMISRSQDYFNNIRNSFKSSFKNYFNNITNDILQNITIQINSLKKYYFDFELYKDNFYFLEKMNNEIYFISNYINDYFNENYIKILGKLEDEKINALDTDFYKIKLYINQYFDEILKKGTFDKIKSGEGYDFKYIKFFLAFLGYFTEKCSHRDNYDKIVNNFNDAYDYFKKESKKISDEFINKYKIYLSEYISINQKMFDSLKDYTNQKINNNTNIKILLSKYKDIFNEMKLKFSNYEQLQQKYKICNTELYINNLGNNLNLIKDEYYTLYYLNNKTEFLEYPKEIIPKIEYIQNQILKIKQPIKEKINSIYEYKILQTHNMIIKFINDINMYNEKYIFNTINFTYIMDDYKLLKIKYINDFFNNFYLEKINQLNNITKSFELNENNYDNPISQMLYNISLFINEFEKEINNRNIEIDKNSDYNNESFINETLDNFTDNLNQTKNELNFSNYHFNVVKLKNSMLYSKNMVKNLYNLFNKFDFKDVINDNLINNLDNIINDKGLLEIYNESNIKLRLINKETYEILKPAYESFIKEFSRKYSFVNDYHSSINLFKKIINISDEKYLNYTNKLNKINLNKIENLLNILNKTFSEFTSPSNISFLNYSLISINQSIENSFNNIKNDIENMKKRDEINKIIEKLLDQKIEEKIDYTKIQVDQFLEKYDIKYINYSINLGEYVSKNMRKDYYDYKFKYIYDYVDLFSNLSKYFDYLNKDIVYLQNNVISKYNEICNYFYLNFISKTLDEEEYNNTDAINSDKINIIEDNVNCSNCTNEINNSSETNITKYYESIFINSSINSIIFDITNIIENSKKNETYLYNYLKENIKLEDYGFILFDISSSFEEFDFYRSLINKNKNQEYKDLLNSSLILYFNKSYTEYINNYVSGVIISNINILINEKLTLYIDLCENKFTDDFQFYKLLLSNTDYLYYINKISFMNLFKDLKIKINNTINDYLKYYLFFNFEQFKNNKRKIFINNFLDFHSFNKNKHVNIYKSNEFVFDIIKEPSFNETLEKIFDNIFTTKIENEIDSILNRGIYNKLNKLFELIDKKNNEFDEILNEIPEKELSYNMNQTIYIIENYNNYLSNFNLKYSFSFSEDPFSLTNDFCNRYLKSPLLSIKNKYNEIEKEILELVTEKLENIEDFSSMIKKDLNLDSKISNIQFYLEQYKSYLLDYYNFFIKEIDQYYCNLANFTIIDEQDYLNSSYNFSFCDIKNKSFTRENFRVLNDKKEINFSKIFKNTPEINNSQNNKERRLGIIEGEYNSYSPPLSKDDIIYFYLFFNETLNSLINEILSKDYEKLKSVVNTSLNELLYKFLPNLKTSVDITERKFSTILTEENLKILYENMYKEYNNINNVVQNYTSLIEENVGSLINALNNTKKFLDLMKNFGYNFIKDVSNKQTEEIQSKLSKKLVGNKILTNKDINKTKIDNGIEKAYNKAQDNYNEIIDNYGKPMITLNNIIYLIDLKEEEFLNIIKKNLEMSQDLNLENLIYGNEMEKLKNKNSIQKETYFRNIDSIVINFDEIAFPYSIPFVFRPSFQLENINIILNIGVDYLYDEDNKQLAKDSEIYQEFKINFIATSNIETSFLIGEGGDISVSFTLQGILSNYMSETIISINFLANSYSILLKAKNSYNFIYSLCYMIKLNSVEHYVLDTKNERKNEELNQFYNKYPFIDPLIDNSLLKKLSLFSSKYLDLENIPQLINKNN